MDRRAGLVGTGVGPGRQQVSNFPACVNAVLEQVTNFCNHGQQKWRGAKRTSNNELQRLLDNDVFCILPDQRITRLNTIQQLRLIQLFCDYFNERELEGRDQYQYFEVIFCGREGETLLHDTRISILTKLCSLAIQYPCYSVLRSVAQWLHKIGSVKTYAQQFVSLLVDHYIVQAEDPETRSYLCPLAEAAPEFAAYFVVYSVTTETLLESLIYTLHHWLREHRSPRILESIREFPTLADHFAKETFPLLVAYDCQVGGALRNPLHPLLLTFYPDWKASMPLNIRRTIELLASDERYINISEETFIYHVQLALLAKITSKKHMMALLDELKSKSNFSTIMKVISGL